MGLVHHAVCLFMPQLSLVLIVPTQEAMARLSWPGWLVRYLDGFDLLDSVPRRCSSTQRQLLHESSPCSSILSGTSSILYGKIQQSTIFFQTVDPSPFWSSFAALSMNVSFHCYLMIPVIGHSWNMSEVPSSSLLNSVNYVVGASEPATANGHPSKY